MITGIQLIANERKRQKKDEGWTPKGDDQYIDDELSRVAAVYAIGPDYEARLQDSDGEIYSVWPDSWSLNWDKRHKHSRKHQLAIAGALIAAEIDRLNRLES